MIMICARGRAGVLSRVSSFLIVLAGLLAATAVVAPARAEEALGIALEGFPYPYPVAFLPLTIEREDLRLAYMDVAPTGAANGRAVLLLHGRNFPSSYWDPTIRALAGAGYRVVVPDQIGFGKSSKPDFAYSFDMMARSTAALLDNLKLDRLDVVGHSMRFHGTGVIEGEEIPGGDALGRPGHVG
jgi:hypothetical protein